MAKTRNSKKQISTSTIKKSSLKKEKTTEKKVAKRVVKTGSASLTWVLKVYKGLDDWHIPIFREAEKFTKANRVLYPGSDKHITASLIFPNVVYVDFNKKLDPVFKDDKVLNWVNENKFYSEETKLKFLCQNFNAISEPENSFDLMISASAGIVSKMCSKFLKVGGYFLVSDAHSDARTAYLMPEFEFVAVYDTSKQALDSSINGKNGHFITTKGVPITKSQVDESTEISRSKRTFKMQKEEMFYLFKKGA